MACPTKKTFRETAANQQSSKDSHGYKAKERTNLNEYKLIGIRGWVGKQIKPKSFMKCLQAEYFQCM